MLDRNNLHAYLSAGIGETTTGDELDAMVVGFGGGRTPGHRYPDAGRRMVALAGTQAGCGLIFHADPGGAQRRQSEHAERGLVAEVLPWEAGGAQVAEAVARIQGGQVKVLYLPIHVLRDPMVLEALDPLVEAPGISASILDGSLFGDAQFYLDYAGTWEDSLSRHPATFVGRVGPATGEITADQPAARIGTADQPVARIGTADQPVARIGTADQPVARIGTADQPVARIGTADQPVARIGTADQPVARIGTADQPAAEVPEDALDPDTLSSILGRGDEDIGADAPLDAGTLSMILERGDDGSSALGDEALDAGTLSMILERGDDGSSALDDEPLDAGSLSKILERGDEGGSLAPGEGELDANTLSMILDRGADGVDQEAPELDINTLSMILDRGADDAGGPPSELDAGRLSMILDRGDRDDDDDEDGVVSQSGGQTIQLGPPPEATGAVTTALLSDDVEGQVLSLDAPEHPGRDGTGAVTSALLTDDVAGALASFGSSPGQAAATSSTSPGDASRPVSSGDAELDSMAERLKTDAGQAVIPDGAALSSFFASSPGTGETDAPAPISEVGSEPEDDLLGMMAARGLPSEDEMRARLETDAGQAVVPDASQLSSFFGPSDVAPEESTPTEPEAEGDLAQKLKTDAGQAVIPDAGTLSSIFMAAPPLVEESGLSDPSGATLSDALGSAGDADQFSAIFRAGSDSGSDSSDAESMSAIFASGDSPAPLPGTDVETFSAIFDLDQPAPSDPFPDAGVDSDGLLEPPPELMDAPPLDDGDVDEMGRDELAAAFSELAGDDLGALGAGGFDPASRPEAEAGAVSRMILPEEVHELETAPPEAAAPLEPDGLGGLGAGGFDPTSRPEPEAGAVSRMILAEEEAELDAAPELAEAPLEAGSPLEPDGLGGLGAGGFDPTSRPEPEAGAVSRMILAEEAAELDAAAEPELSAAPEIEIDAGPVDLENLAAGGFDPTSRPAPEAGSVSAMLLPDDPALSGEVTAAGDAEIPEDAPALDFEDTSFDGLLAATGDGPRDPEAGEVTNMILPGDEMPPAFDDDVDAETLSDALAGAVDSSDIDLDLASDTDAETLSGIFGGPSDDGTKGTAEDWSSTPSGPVVTDASSPDLMAELQGLESGTSDVSGASFGAADIAESLSGVFSDPGGEEDAGETLSGIFGSDLDEGSSADGQSLSGIFGDAAGSTGSAGSGISDASSAGPLDGGGAESLSQIFGDSGDEGLSAAFEESFDPGSLEDSAVDDSVAAIEGPTLSAVMADSDAVSGLDAAGLTKQLQDAFGLDEEPAPAPASAELDGLAAGGFDPADRPAQEPGVVSRQILPGEGLEAALDDLSADEDQDEATFSQLLSDPAEGLELLEEPAPELTPAPAEEGTEVPDLESLSGIFGEDASETASSAASLGLDEDTFSAVFGDVDDTGLDDGPVDVEPGQLFADLPGPESEPGQGSDGFDDLLGSLAAGGAGERREQEAGEISQQLLPGEQILELDDDALAEGRDLSAEFEALAGLSGDLDGVGLEEDGLDDAGSALEAMAAATAGLGDLDDPGLADPAETDDLATGMSLDDVFGDLAPGDSAVLGQADPGPAEPELAEPELAEPLELAEPADLGSGASTSEAEMAALLESPEVAEPAGDDLELAAPMDLGVELPELADPGLEIAEPVDLDFEIPEAADGSLELAAPMDLGVEMPELSDASRELAEPMDLGVELAQPADLGVEIPEPADFALEPAPEFEIPEPAASPKASADYDPSDLMSGLANLASKEGAAPVRDPSSVTALIQPGQQHPGTAAEDLEASLAERLSQSSFEGQTPSPAGPPTSPDLAGLDALIGLDVEGLQKVEEPASGAFDLDELGPLPEPGERPLDLSTRPGEAMIPEAAPRGGDLATRPGEARIPEAGPGLVTSAGQAEVSDDMLPPLPPMGGQQLDFETDFGAPAGMNTAAGQATIPDLQDDGGDQLAGLLGSLEPGQVPDFELAGSPSGEPAGLDALDDFALEPVDEVAVDALAGLELSPVGDDHEADESVAIDFGDAPDLGSIDELLQAPVSLPADQPKGPRPSAGLAQALDDAIDSGAAAGGALDFDSGVDASDASLAVDTLLAGIGTEVLSTPALDESGVRPTPAEVPARIEASAKAAAPSPERRSPPKAPPGGAPRRSVREVFDLPPALAAIYEGAQGDLREVSTKLEQIWRRDDDEAFALLRTVLDVARSFPGDKVARYAEGTVHLMRNRRFEGLAALRRASELARAEGDLLGLGFLLEQLRERMPDDPGIGEALAEHYKDNNRNQDAAEVHTEIGAQSLEEGRAREAVQHFERAHALQPGGHGVAAKLLRALHALGAEARALEFCNDYLSTRPNSPLVLAHQGIAWERLARPGDAKKAFDKAFDKAGRDITRLEELFHEFREAGHDAGKRRAKDRILELDPDNMAIQAASEAAARARALERGEVLEAPPVVPEFVEPALVPVAGAAEEAPTYTGDDPFGRAEAAAPKFAAPLRELARLAADLDGGEEDGIPIGDTPLAELMRRYLSVGELLQRDAPAEARGLIEHSRSWLRRFEDPTLLFMWKERIEAQLREAREEARAA